MPRAKGKLYIAYGSNLNLEQMKHRCPTAKVVGKAELKDYRLRFRGGKHCAVATVEATEGYTVPVLVWRIQPKDEQSLDVYEGWPRLYRKEVWPVKLKGKTVKAMIYIMNEAGHPYDIPSVSYFHCIRAGYESAGFDTKALHRDAMSAWEISENNKESEDKYHD